MPTRSHPHISVDEVDDEEVVMRVFAVPELDRDGPKLADEILAAIGQVTGRDTEGANGNGNGRLDANGDDPAGAEPPPSGEQSSPQGDRITVPRA